MEATHSYVCYVGFNRRLNLTCPTCKGKHASNEKSQCPKCGQHLVPLTYVSENETRQYFHNEVTLYVKYNNEAEQNSYNESVDKAHGARPTIRMLLWSHWDKE